MIEGRVASLPSQKPAIIDYGGDKYPCTVRDISSTGAALAFSDLVSLIRRAKAFTLLIPEDGLKRSCHIVWQWDYRMGVTFD